MFKKLYLCISLLAAIVAQAEESLLMQMSQILREHQSSQNTAQIPKLVILDNDKAGEATTVIVTIVRDVAGSDEKLEKMLEYVKVIYGTLTVQDDTMVKFIFERRDMSADVWLNFLSAVEGTFVAVRSTVEGYTKNNAHVTIELK